MRAIFRGLAALIVTGSLLSTAAAAQDYGNVRARTLYEQLRDDDHCEAALPEARVFWQGREFQSLTQPAQFALLGAITICAWQMEDGALAISTARAARETNPAWGDRVLMALGLQFDDDGLAVESFSNLTRSDPERIKELDDRTAWRVLGAAERSDPSGAAEVRIHDALMLYKFAPSDAVIDEALRFDHARALLRTGDVARARVRIGTLIDPRHVLAFRVNRLFDPLRGEAGLANLDVLAAAEANLARVRGIAEVNPRSLEDTMSVSRALRALGRDEEALALIDAGVGRCRG